MSSVSAWVAVGRLAKPAVGMAAVLACVSGLMGVCVPNAERAEVEAAAPKSAKPASGPGVAKGVRSAPRPKSPYKSPYAAAFAPDGQTLYVTFSTADALGVVDVKSRRVVAEIPVGAEPRGVSVAADGRTAYVACHGSHSLAVVDLTSRKLLYEIAVGYYPEDVVVNADATRAWVSNSRQTSVSEVDLAAKQEASKILTDGKPQRLALLADGKTLLVPCDAARKDEGRVLMRIDTGSKQATATRIDMAANVRGVAVSPEGQFALVAHQRAKIRRPSTDIDGGWIFTNAVSLVPLTESSPLGRNVQSALLDLPERFCADPCDVKITPDQKTAVVTSSGGNSVLVLDLPRLVAWVQRPGRAIARTEGAPFQSNRLFTDLQGALRDRGFTSVNLLKVQPGQLPPAEPIRLYEAWGTVLTGQLLLQSTSSNLNTTLGGSGGSGNPQQLQQAAQTAAGQATDPARRQQIQQQLQQVSNARSLFDQILQALYNGADNLSESQNYVRARLSTPINPRYSAMSPDGKWLWVCCTLDDSLAAVELATGRVYRAPVGTAAVSVVRRGEQIFHDGQFCRKAAFTCASCHPGGADDGEAWELAAEKDVPGFVSTKSLLGTGNAGPFGWHGELTQLTARVSDTFNMTMQGQLRRNEIDAVAAYLKSLPAPRHPEADEIAESPAAERGKKIFAGKGQCIRCHSGPNMTNGSSHDFGLGGVFKVPSLKGVWASAPYLHTNAAGRLEDLASQTCNPQRKHGKWSELTAAEVSDLVEFLKTL